MQDSFSSLAFSKAQLTNLDSLGYKTMTAIQAQAIPPILQGKDLIAQAKTGSGKTAAFGLGLLAHINPRFFGAQALVLCPTRELADQVAKELRKLARSIANIKLMVLCGGQSFGYQKASLRHGAHIIVGTPGRIQDHLNRETLNLESLETLVLDEADRMLDMGFLEVIEEIIEQTPKTRQTLLFSATYPNSIKKMCMRVLKDPVNVKVEAEHLEGTIKQAFYHVKNYQRTDILLALFEHYQPKSTVVFCQTKIQCREVAEFLTKHQIETLALHGDLEQRDRDQVLACFSNGSCSVLVATDVAARGLDIKSLDVVINFELPRDPEIYVHRIGRTGRAGETGVALSLFTDSEKRRFDILETIQTKPYKIDDLASLNRDTAFKAHPTMATIQINVGRKNKIRVGDILGALTGDGGLKGSEIGKINLFDLHSYIAIDRKATQKILDYFSTGKIKGRAVRARKL